MNKVEDKYPSRSNCKTPPKYENNDIKFVPKIILNDHLKNQVKQNKSNCVELPSIKNNSIKNNKNNINNEFQNSLIIKNKINQNKFKYHDINKIDNNSLDNINTGIETKNNIYKIKDYNTKNYSLYQNKNIFNLKKSASAIYGDKSIKIFSKYKMPDIHLFHKNLMSINKLACKKSLREKYLEILEEDNDKKENYIKSLFEDKNKKIIKTGIFGPNTNIVSIIRAKMERLRYDNMYKGVDEEIKELIKDEIMDAQVKLKRKPQSLVYNKNRIKPLYIKKMEKYNYLSRMNKIRELNQNSNIPVIEKDSKIMLKLFNDAFDILRKKK